MATSTFAQVQTDKLRIVPTVEGDAPTEFLIATHHTANSGNIATIEDGKEIGSMPAGGGAWIEYQVVSPEGGDFAAVLTMGTARVGSEVNATLYKTETEIWVRGGNTVSIAMDGWGIAKGTDYYFPVSLEEGVTYTIRVNFETAGCNLYAVAFKKTEGSTDATLSGLVINGDSIENFDPQTTSYNVPLNPGQWIESMVAVPNHELATVEVPTDFTQVGNTGTYTVTVTSESGVTKDYSVTVAAPVEIYEGLAWTGDAWATSNVYTNKGAGVRSWGINNLNNGDYVDFYVFSYYDGNYEVKLNYTNGYGPPADLTVASYLNVSTVGLGEEDIWEVNDIYTKYLAPTLDDTDTARWDPADLWAQDVSFIVSLKAEEPTLLRIYSITNRGNAANIQGATFAEIIDVSVDATLGDLQLNGVSVPGFDPNITSYSIPVPVGTNSVDITATASDLKATVTGAGSVDIAGFVSTDTITVTSEFGNTINYKINFVSALELAFTEDTVSIMMGDWAFRNGGVNANNDRINSINNEEYIEYYLFSATDKDVHLVMNVANGNVVSDTVYAKINVSTYVAGSEWILGEVNSMNIHGMGELEGTNSWAAEYASDVKYNLSLKAGEAVVLRIYGITNGAGAGDIYSLVLVEGKTDYGTAIETAETSNLKVWGGSRSLNVRCNEAFVGGAIQIYDLSGQLITSDRITSTHSIYNLKQSGLYFVRVIGENNAVQTTKCIVR